MRTLERIALALACLASGSCGESPDAPRVDSRLEVYVHWNDEGLADKRLELLQLHLEKLTDDRGVAVFLVPTGKYTLRAYQINTPGPGLPYVDFTVTTIRDQTTRLEVVDCVVCQ